MSRLHYPLAALLAALCAGPLQAAQPPPPPAEEPITAADITVRYMLQDHFGKVITDLDYRGRFQLITFGYTHCPDICPTTLAEMAQIMGQLGDRGTDRILPLFVTLDPERDTPPRLREYVTYFHPAIIGLTGSPQLVAAAAKNFRVRYEKVRDPDAPADQYWMDHSAGIYLLGPNGEFLTKFAYATPVAEIVPKIREFLDME